MDRNFPGRGKVAVVRTSPETVLEDTAKVMRMAGYQEHIDPSASISLKVNISWQVFYPACSTTPWQLEGVIRTLLQDGYPAENLHACHNRTVVVSAYEGEVNNRQKPVVEAYGLRNVHIYEPEIEWMRYEPKEPLLVLDQVYPNGIYIPKFFVGENVIHLPTMKTHVFTTTTGAMKNAFGGLLNENRHWTHSVIHETLVDLLTIQHEIHPGVFAVMDGTVAGDGPGPRAMRPHIKNYLLASADQVAIDSIAQKMMGFDPMQTKFTRLAHEKGLGVANPREIEVLGEDIEGVNWGFQGQEDTFASRGQKLIYWGPLKPLENMLLRSPIVPWSFAASNLYHNTYWYNRIGRKRVDEFLQSDWGKLFLSYPGPDISEQEVGALTTGERA
jgi:uncharacterized protein (DUF362 family)